MWEAGHEDSTGEGSALPLAVATAVGSARGVAATQAPPGSETTLLGDTRWGSERDAASSGPMAISFSFVNASSVFADAFGSGDFQSTMRELRTADKAQLREILAAIESVCKLRFVEVDDNAAGNGTLRYGYSKGPNDQGLGGYAYFPSASPQGGDVWIGQMQMGAEWDFYRPYLLLHETLHALGLKHPSSGSNILPASLDAIPNTVMSSSAVAGLTVGALSSYPAEPMPLDILALQAFYGASENNVRDTVYDLSSSRWGSGFHVIWDTGGIDLLDASRCTSGVTLDLRHGGRSDVGDSIYAFARGGNGAGPSIQQATYQYTLTMGGSSVVENATGSAQADILIGNEGANILRGGDGNDMLAGLGGGDLLAGGAGNDTAVYSGNRGEYLVGRDGADFNVMRRDGAALTDRLLSVERIAFADTSVAFDLDGHAGEAVTLLGTVLGARAVFAPGPLGVMMTLLDAGTTPLQLAELLLGLVMGEAPDAAVVQLIYQKVAGRAPDADALAYWVGTLDSGALTRGSFALLAAGTDANKANVNLAGLAQSGLAFTVDYF